ncbi:unnamed protein product [Rhodiola kirilowii]
MNAAKSSPIRVLARPQSNPTLNSSLPSKAPPIPPPVTSEAQQIATRPSFPDKVVVVGFIGQRSDDVTQLINRILDANVFGSGKVDRSLVLEKDGEVSEELRRWLKWHRISYYHEEERGILFLQFASVDWLELGEETVEFDSAVEDWELGNYKGMLLMFSVCHVIVYVQEGSRFSTQVLKKLQVLQAAKHSLSPFIRSQISSSGAGMPHSASFSHPPETVFSSKNPSPGNSRGGLRRNASSFSGVSGLGSSTSMFPGNCTPVTVFVFLDDFSDMASSSSTSEVSTDKSFEHSAKASSLAKPGLPVKGSGSVVVLARPATKTEQSPHKKLQSSLEAQIRFLVKKSKLQTGPERSRSGPRSGVFPSSAPLLSLDASKAVILVDKLSNQKGKSLDIACRLVGDILSGKATSDILLLENHIQMANQDDFKSLQEFILRQSDIFRGRGGSVSTGVGMIAAAVAAATASASSGKSIVVPELPNLKTWLSDSQLILNGLVYHKLGCLDGTETCIRNDHEKPISSKVDDQRSIEAVDSAISLLESGSGLNSKFSYLWCQRVLPAAKEVYLQDLPSCYPTGQHETHLQKALNAFHSMVKGPAVQRFSKKLEEECIFIWKSGRQLCDAVSLTGKPCVHQRHDLNMDLPPSNATVGSHSSGFVFLHACACGRSRFLRPDPFDFETANRSSLCPPECSKLLHGLQFPQISAGGDIKSAAWNLIRIGAASYYDPAKGLLQSGFCTSQKFLLSWIVFLERPNYSKVAPVMIGSTVDSKVEGTPNIETEKDTAIQLYQREPEGIVNRRTSSMTDKANGKTINTVRELPNSTIRKPFSEVVAGSAASDTDFPPLKHSKHVLLGTGKGLKQRDVGNRSPVKVYANSTSHDPQKNLDSAGQIDNVNSSIKDKDNWPHLQIGNNAIPIGFDGSENSQGNASSKQVAVYIGFEYECSYGHRFILSPEHLSELSLFDPASEESLSSRSIRNVNRKFSETENVTKSSSPSKNQQQLNGTITTVHKGKRNGKSKEKNPPKSRERMSTGAQLDYLVNGAWSGKEHNYPQRGMPPHLKSAYNIVESLQSVSLDDSSSAISLLNRNLPIYINCPHCKNSTHKRDAQNVKFAGTTSQLQRIFMVTPPLPIVLATCPVVQYETSCLPPSIPNREEKLQFSPACNVILPPESFIVLRLPFIYGVQMEDGSLQPLTPYENQPELTAWVVKQTALQIVSGGFSHSG